MSPADWLLDGLLGLTLLWLAWRTLWTADPFNAVVQFIGLGLLMALAWVRLAAPDLALVEAALGAGVMGALLLASVGRMERDETRRGDDEES